MIPPKQKKTSGFLKKIIIKLFIIERKYATKIKNSIILKKIINIELFSFQQGAVSRGLAIGLFWAFIPIPFQMIPAILSCWLSFANIPIAVLCVWISNPLTYIPIFFVEYQVGLLFHLSDTSIIELSWEEFSHYFNIVLNVIYSKNDSFKDSLQIFLQNTENLFIQLYIITLKGALVLGVLLAIAGYIIGYPLSKQLTSYRRRKKKPHLLS